MKKVFYQKNQRVDNISVAGEDFYQYSQDGVIGDLFITGNKVEIPDVRSKYQGQGNFKRWLTEIENEFEVVKFNTVINENLQNYLLKRGYKIDKAGNLIKNSPVDNS